MIKIEDIQADCVGLYFPELYELRKKGEKKYLAMLCVIGGVLTLEYPSIDGEIIFKKNIEGRHCFEHYERAHWLEESKKALVDFLNSLDGGGEEDDIQRMSQE